MLNQGTCWLRSESDPRWDVSMRGDVGMFMQVEQSPLRDTYKGLKEQLGEPPDDLRGRS